LIYGTDRYMRICDIRSSIGYKSTIEDCHAKQVLGIKFDPFEPRRFASYSEDYIKVFDLRNTKYAMMTIKEEENT
jgi:WD40 repeat protein